MSYAQTNYLQPQGIPPTRYTIAETGCFITSFCNLLTDRFNKPIDPVTFNAIFRDRGLFIDVDDGHRDDLSWNSVTAYDGQVVVVATGSGWPASNNSIVKFSYISPRTHIQTTHFCLIADAAAHTIVDPWDGRIKQSGIYGTPVAYASYASAQAQSVTPITAPAPQVNAGKQLFLPSAAGTWRVYPMGGQVLVGKEVGKLSPASYPLGLTYDIIANIAPNIYKIHTDTYGDVQIYAGPDTIAEFRDPAPVATPPAPTPPVVVAPPVEPTTPAEAPSEAVPIDVRIDDKLWQKSFKTEYTDYRAKATVHITDLDTGLSIAPDLTIDTIVHGGGTVTKDGRIYVRTIKSVLANTWVCVPLEILYLVKTQTNDITDAEYKALNMTLPKGTYDSSRTKVIKVIASLYGMFEKLLTLGAKKNK